MPAARRWLLPASFALNIFLAVALAAHALRPGFGPPPPPPKPDKLMERIAETLPPADAAILRRAFAEQKPGLDRFRDHRDDFPERVRRTLQADNFDADQLSRVLAEGRKRRDEFETALETLLVTAAAAMSPEGRRKLADWRPLGGPPGPPPGPPPDGGHRGPPPPRP